MTAPFQWIFLVAYIIGREIPWQISLYKYSEGQHVCGGSILSRIWIVTAAHCVYKTDKSDLLVKAGLVQLSDPGLSEQTGNISLVITHEKFNPNLGSFGANDLALLRLESRMIFNQYVFSVPLPQMNYSAKGNGLVSGWGALREGGPISNELNQVELPILSFAECRDYYGDDVSQELLCAGFDEGEKDACQGDSGGPLTCEGKSVLCGIVSAGDGCAREGLPGVYTNVVAYLDWLSQNMIERSYK